MNILYILIFSGFDYSDDYCAKCLEHFYNNERDFKIVSQYIADSEYEDVYITLIPEWNYPFMFVGTEDGYVEITDEDIISAIEDLQKNHCEVIIKGENEVYFQIYSNKDKGYGMIYSLQDANFYNESLNISKRSDKAEEGWHYCESN